MAVTWTYDVPAEGETTVEVTFTSDSPALTHTRAVNAVFEGDAYSAPLTEARVAEVGAGVENKIAVGVITPPTDESEEGGE